MTVAHDILAPQRVKENEPMLFNSHTRDLAHLHCVRGFKQCIRRRRTSGCRWYHSVYHFLYFENVLKPTPWQHIRSGALTGQRSSSTYKSLRVWIALEIPTKHCIYSNTWAWTIFFATTFELNTHGYLQAAELLSNYSIRQHIFNRLSIKPLEN